MVDPAPLSPGLIDSSSTELSIPEDGLDEVLRAWNGTGQLLSAVAASKGDDASYDWDWSSTDIRRRANRTLFAEIEPFLVRWPVRLADWMRALPAESRRIREVTAAPAGRVAWAETFRRSGWPPGRFVVKTRHRVADELLTTTLRWTIEQVAAVRDDAVFVAPGLDSAVTSQLRIAAAVLDLPPVSDSEGQRPSLTDIRAMSRQGWPWTAVAQVAARIRAAGASVHEYARRLLMPDDDLRPKLFHLAVLGQLLIALRDLGASTLSVRPLARTTAGPAYRIRIGDTEWDLWFEAGGIWSFYGRASPYLAATSALKGSPRPLSPDLMLIRLDQAALVIECKYSANADYVGGRGLSQAMAYATEAITALAPRVVSRVVAPSETLKLATASVNTAVGTVGIIDAYHFEALLEELAFGGAP